MTAATASTGGAHRERGAISVFLAVLVPGLLLIIGLAVDGGAKVAATQRANAIADEAARAGGQALDVSAALAGQVRVDPAAAVAAAQDYLDRNDVARRRDRRRRRHPAA